MKILMKRYVIKNLPARFSEYINDYMYTVARECPDGNWYYGVYNNIEYASRVAREIGNGFVVESKNVIYDQYRIIKS